MKKLSILFMGMLFCLTLGLMSCNGCKNNVEPAANETEVVETAELNVENLVAMDREAMFLKFGEDYRWFETGVLLPEYLDAEEVTSTPDMVVNVFQAIVNRENGYDTWVYKFQHFADGTVVQDSIQGFWVEDNPLNEEEITLTYADAYEKLMEVNAPKPHSKNCILRKPVGPVACNAQYVFGNIREQLWIDAKTGDVKNSNPAFPEEQGFKMPLGEWP